MKTLTFIAVLLLLTLTAIAQVPQGFNYQAVARNSSGDPLINQNICLKLSIHTGIAGPVVYWEKDSVLTNAFGLFTLKFGMATTDSGTFSTIAWNTGNQYLQVGMDLTCTNTYTDLGTSQLLTVPYAMYASSGAAGPTGATGAAGTNGTNGTNGATGVTGATGATGSVNGTAWGILGNSGTTLGTNFIGTTDAQAIDFRTNDTLKVRITQKGQIETYNTGNSVFLGQGAGANDNLNSRKNVFIGDSAGYSNTTGFCNSVTGYQALYSNTIGHNNTANGFGALYSNTSGFYNTAIGFYSLYSDSSGYSNSAVGYQALYSNTSGYSNTAFGLQALYSDTSGNSNIANGYQALFKNTDGADNTAVGVEALLHNTIGYYNTALGANADVADTNINDAMALGANAITNASNKIVIGTTSNTNLTGGYGNWQNWSDGRFKQNINEDVPGLSFITKLRPVTYNLNAQKMDEFLGIKQRMDTCKNTEEKNRYFQRLKEVHP